MLPEEAVTFLAEPGVKLYRCVEGHHRLTAIMELREELFREKNLKILHQLKQVKGSVHKYMGDLAEVIVAEGKPDL